MVSLINYVDLKTPVTERSHDESFESSIPSGNSSFSVNSMGPSNIVTIQSEARADEVITNDSQPIAPNENLESDPFSCDEFTNKIHNRDAPNINFRGHLECINSWIPALEKTKSNIIRLIDDHIHSLKEGAHVVQSQQDDFMNKLKMAQTEKAIQREACIQRIREELTFRMDNLNNLLDQLEHI